MAIKKKKKQGEISMSAKWIEQFNIESTTYEVYRLSERDFKQMVEQFLNEECGEKIPVSFYSCEETFQLGIIIEEQESALGERLEELLGSSYWDDCYSAMFSLNKYLFGDSFENAYYIPSTLHQENPMIEFYCLNH